MKTIDYTKYPVPRIRHHSKPVYYIPLKQLKNRNFSYPPLIEKFNWNELFADGKAPTVLDVGCGLGKFLIETAVSYPAENILGFEVRLMAVEWICRVLNGEKIRNAGVLWYSVVNGFPFIETSSIEKIYYLFPDPWIKKRHYKRRAFTVELLDEFYRMLKLNGKLYIMTDVPEVDEHHRKILEEHNKFEFKYTDEAASGMEIKTNQEEFCISKDIPFTRMVCLKK